MNNMTTTKTHTYRIETTDGCTWMDVYSTRAAAVVRIADAYDWDAAAVVVSESYTVATLDRDETSAVSVYETQEDCDADQDGAHAPRIVTVEAVKVQSSSSGS